MLTTLKSELSVCTSISRLVGRSDTLTYLVNTLLSCRSQLASNSDVLETVTRLCRIQTLLKHRNQLRLAIELCSERGIKYCLTVR